MSFEARQWYHWKVSAFAEKCHNALNQVLTDEYAVNVRLPRCQLTIAAAVPPD